MKEEKLLEDSAIDICIQKIALELNKNMLEYEKSKDKKIKLKIIKLIKDRDLIYANDKKTIKKYLENGSK